MHRFFVSSVDVFDNYIRLSDGDAKHIRSLRLRPSEFFVVCDGVGSDYLCKLGEKADVFEFGINCVAEIFDKFPSVGEPALRCSVYIAYSKGDRLDYAVQKSVELGAFEIVLFPSARCVSVPTDAQKKLVRLQKIALETAKQCNRGRVPLVLSAKSFNDAISLACEADLPLFFYELEESNGLKAILEHASMGSSGNHVPLGSVSIVTGPEGGFESHEADAAISAGLVSASLGRRILRSETAPIAALAAVMFFSGEM